MALQDKTVGRRDALLRAVGLGAGAAGLGFWLKSRSRYPEEPSAAFAKRSFTVPPDPARPAMSVVQGEEPRQNLRRAIQELGGMRRFIGRGDVVVIKPNASWDRTPE